MKLKVFISEKRFKFVSVTVADDVKLISNEYDRWEYVL